MSENTLDAAIDEIKALREKLERAKDTLRYYQAKDIVSKNEAEKLIHNKPHLHVPPLADWSEAHRCLQELED